MKARMKPAATLALPLVLGGCVTAGEYAVKNAGFSLVAATTAEAAGKQTVWVQNQEQARSVSERVKALMAKKAIDVETAVQVALLNNKGLQAAYADLGESAADAWQATMLVNPTVGVGLTESARLDLRRSGRSRARSSPTFSRSSPATGISRSPTPSSGRRSWMPLRARCSLLPRRGVPGSMP